VSDHSTSRGDAGKAGEGDAGAEAPRVLAERFVIERPIGRGGQGQLYLATDARTGQRVAVKELLLRRAECWKRIELFEREGRALERIDHPAVPAYVEALHEPAADGRLERFLLVQEYVEGVDLSVRIAQGWRATEAEVRWLLASLLEVLDYLHNLAPPVVHRDIKPANIILRADGGLSVVDFGAVQLLAASDASGSTVVGTSGYMPLEQLMGRSVPATDLYALGATAVHLLSHRHPAELPVDHMRLVFRPFVSITPDLAAFLDWLLEPDATDRPASAREALEALRDGRAGQAHLDAVPDEPTPAAPEEHEGFAIEGAPTFYLGAASTAETGESLAGNIARGCVTVVFVVFLFLWTCIATTGGC